MGSHRESLVYNRRKECCLETDWLSISLCTWTDSTSHFSYFQCQKVKPHKHTKIPMRQAKSCRKLLTATWEMSEANRQAYCSWCNEGRTLNKVMCALDGATRGPDIWSNIILGVSGSVCLDEMNIWLSRLRKADCPPQCRWASSQRKAWVEQWVGKRKLLLPDCLQLGLWSFPAFGLALKHWLFLKL